MDYHEYIKKALLEVPTYLLARAIQFFAPSIPQVYYVGLLAGENDIALMEETKNGRDINRHYYSLEEIENEVKRPVVKNLLKLMKFRNEHPAFAVDGDIAVDLSDSHNIIITRTYQDHLAKLIANLETYTYIIQHS